MFEINDEGDFEIGYFQVVEHLTNFIRSYFINRLDVYNDAVKNNQVRNKFINQFIFEIDREPFLLRINNSALPKFHGQRPFVSFFPQPMPDAIMNLQGALDNVIDLLPE